MQVQSSHIYLRIADITIDLTFTPTIYPFPSEKLKKEITHYFSGFICRPQGQVDFTVVFKELVIRSEYQTGNEPMRYIPFYMHRQRTRQFTSYYHISIFQFELILNKILHLSLKRKKGFILHAGGNVTHKGALLFTGKSGVGKSTAITSLHPLYSAFADDMVVVYPAQMNQYCVYSTHVIEKNTWIHKKKSRYPLVAILFLKQSDKFTINKMVDKKEIHENILSQLIVHEESMKTQIVNINKFVNTFKGFYKLGCRKDESGLQNFITGFLRDNFTSRV